MAEPMHARRAAHRNRSAVAPPPVLRIVPGTLRARPELLRSTALQAVFLAGLAVPGIAAAQTMPAATALPTGATVIAGQASIATTTAPGSASMTVKQATGYGAYDWKSFDIGKSASVTYQVPTSQAISVNRVISPTSPSIIAGKLSSNGVLVVQNQSGVVFTQGAEVNVNTLIATAPGLSDANARAGRLIFDQPANPGARVENHGTITVAQTGLAALVAPQVANSGVIRAQMGRVVLAGAEAHTVDLYGDGLLSIDVTKQVTQVPLGADGKAATALVTNSGTILADGGTILLTASAVDGLVQTLVTAGGQIQANTAGTTTGRIAVTGRGGNVVVSGTIAATGTTDGSKGGQIEINAPSRSVTLKTTARVDASGRAGGGSIAVGTTLARGGGRTTVKAPTSKVVIVETGARVAADATQAGNGGDITLLSSGGVTAHWGELSARGGPNGGNGGFIEVSGDSFFLGGGVDTSAPGGTYGTVLLDPTDLTIGTPSNKTVTPNSDTFTTADIKNGTTLDPANIVGNMKGDIVLTTSAGGTLTVASALDVTTNADIKSVTLVSDGDLKVNAAITGGGSITLKNTLGNMTIAAAVTTADGKTITLDSAGSIALNGNVTSATGIIDLNAGAGITQLAGKSLLAGTVQSSTGITGDVALTSAANQIGALGAMTIKNGNLSVVNGAALGISGVVLLEAGKVASFAVPGFSVAGKLDTTATGTVELAPTSGTMSLGKADATELTLTQASLDNITAGTLQLGSASAGGATAGTITLRDALDASAVTTTKLVAGAGGVVLTAGPLTAGTLDITSTGGVTDNGAVIVAARLLSSGGITGDVLLNNAAHGIAALGDIAVTGGLQLATSGAVKVEGKVQATGDIGLESAAADAAAIDIAGTLAQTASGKTVTLTTGAAGGIAISGTLDTTPGGTLSLDVGSKGLAQGAGVVTTGTLTGKAAATVDLDQPANAIGSVGALTVTGGDLVLVSAAPVAVTGALVADNVSITGGAAAANAVSVAAGGSIAPAAGGAIVLVASDGGAGGIALAGSLTTTGKIDLSAGAGGISQTDGSLVAASLVSTGGIAGTASLGMAANAIGATGAIKVTGGDLILASSTALDIAGTLSVEASQTLSLGLGGIKAFGGALSAPGGTVEIAPLDGKTMSLGTPAATEFAVTAAHLTKIAATTLRLGGASAAPDRAESLVVQDSVTAPTAVLRLDAGAGGISVKSGVLSATTLDLNTTGGGVATGAGATIAAAQVQSSTGVTGDVKLAASVNAIAALGTLAISGGALELATDKALAITGKVSATAISIDSSDASAGAINLTGNLGATAGGNVTLTASNAAGGIALAGGIDTTGTLALVAGSGGIAQTAGTAAAGVLTAKSAGAIAVAGTLTGTAIDLASDAASATAINLTGSLAASAGGTVSLTASNAAGGIALAGSIDTSGTLALSAKTGGIAQTGGAAVAGVLTATTGGALDLAATDNKLAVIGDVTVTGDASIASAAATKLTGTLAAANVTLASTADSATALTIAGTVKTAGTAALSATKAGGGIALSGTVEATTGIALAAGAGGITQSDGALVTAVLSSPGSGGAVVLTAKDNAVDALGAFAVTGKGGLALTTGSGLSTTGAISTTAGDIVLRATAPASGITLGGNVTAAGTLDLSAGTGGVVQNAGTVSATVLTSAEGIGGQVTLDKAGNAIAAIGAMSVTGGGFSLTNAAALSVTGPLAVTGGGLVLDITDNAGKGGLQLPGAVSGDAITLISQGTSGSIVIGGTLTKVGKLDLVATAGGVTAGGILDVDVLGSTKGVVGGLTASNAANSIGTLDALAVTGGNIAIATKAGTSLTVNGAVSVEPGASIQLTADGLPFTATGALVATGGTVDIRTRTVGIGLGDGLPGELAVPQATVDAITTGTLALTATGAAITLRDTLDTSVKVATLLLAADNGIALANGTLSAKAIEVSTAAGGLTQAPAGLLTADVLSANPGGLTGPVSLANDANKISALGLITASDAVAVTSAVAMDVTGAIKAPGIALVGGAAAGTALSLAGTGSLGLTGAGTIAVGATSPAAAVALVGTVNATSGGTLLLTGAGAVDQSAGAVTAGTVSTAGAIAAASLAQPGNAISMLADATVLGALDLATTQALTAAGTTSAGAATLTSSAGSASAITLAAKSTLSVAPGGTATLAATAGAGGIVLAGDLNAPAGVLDLRAGSAGVAQSAGTITAGILTSTGDVGGATTLTQTNAIAGLGALKAAGTLALVSSATVDVSAPVAGTGIALTAAGMTFSGAGALSAATGTIEIGPLAADTAFRLGTTVPATAFNLGDLKNVTASLLRIGQAAGGAKAGSIALSGVVDPTATTLDLISAGAISQATGGLDIAVLTATAASLNLDNSGNSISKLGALTIDGLLAVATSGTLSVDSTLSAGSITLRSFAGGANALSIGGTLATAADGTITLAAESGGIALAGKVDATTSGTITLTAGIGGIDQSAGSLTAELLQGASKGVAKLDQPGNAVAKLGDFAAPDVALTVRNGAALDITGAVSAANATIRGATLKLSGSLVATDTATLASTDPTGGIVLAGIANVTNTLTLAAGLGGIQQPAGGITAGTLTGISSGTVTLGQSVNSIGTLGAFSVTGAPFSLTDSAALTVSGAVLASAVTLIDTSFSSKAISVTGAITTTGGPIALAAANGGIALSGTLDATAAGTIDLQAGAGGIAQSGGATTAGLLQGKSAGQVALTAGTNSIGKLGNFTADSTLLLTGSIALDIAGTVSSGGATIAAPSLTLSGSLTSTGAAELDAAGAMSLSGTINAPSLALNAGAGGIVQSGGAILTPALTVDVTLGGVSLKQEANGIDALVAATLTGGALSLTTGKALSVTGAVLADSITLTGNAGGTAIDLSGSLTTNGVGIVTLAAKAGAIRLAGDVTAAGGTLDLFALSSVTQEAGAVSAGTLRSTGGIGGALSLASATNGIGKIDTLAVAGAVTVKGSVALDIAGALSGDSVSIANSAAGTAITVSGTASATAGMTLLASDPAGGIALSGPVKAATLDLSAGTGGIAQGGGSITATTLQSALGSKGDVKLGEEANAIGTLGAFDASGKLFTLQDSIALTVAGPVVASPLSLFSSAAVAKALDITGDVTGGTILTLTAKNATGGIALSGNVAAPGIASFSAGSGGIIQSAGTLSAKVLSAGATGGSVVLTQASNSVVDLFPSKVTGGSFSLTSKSFFSVNGLEADNVALTALSGGITTKLAGIVTNAAGTILLDTAGGIALEGPVNAKATGTVDLRVAVGDITQTGTGIITAGTLTSVGTIDGAVALGIANNSIATIASLAATGPVALRDTAALTVTTLLSGADVTVTDTSAAAAALSVGPAGAIRAGTGGTVALSTTGGMSLAGVLDATATGVLTFASGGAITQTGGSIVAGTLLGTGTIGGAVDLGQPGNAVSKLGPMTVAGGLTLVDSIPLTVAGALTAKSGGIAIVDSGGGVGAITVNAPITANGQTVSLTASAADGGIAIGADVSAATLNLAAGTGGVAQSGGTLVLDVLASPGIGAAASFNQPTNTIGAIGAFLAAGDIALRNATALAVAGKLQSTGGGITLSVASAATPALTVSGTIESGSGKATTLAANGAMVVKGQVNAPGGQLILATNDAMTIDGQVNVPGGMLSLASAKGVSATGAVSAGKLAVSASLPANVELTGANSIGVLNSAILADGTFLLNNNTPLTIAGPITARLLGINVTNSLTVLNGVAITTDGISRATQYPVPLDNLAIANLNPDTGGTAKFGSFMAVKSTSPGKIEIGEITITPFSLAQATFDLILPNVPGGTINLGQLKAPSTDLILATRFGGSSKGIIDVAALLVLGSGGAADLAGKIGGLEGQAAASKAVIWPQPSADYRFNACPITSINCVLLPVQTIPPISPLRDVPIIRDRPTQDDTDVQLPNVSDEDY